MLASPALRRAWLFASLFCCFDAFSQPNFTALDGPPLPTPVFRLGYNVGYYPSWTDEKIGSLAAGDPSLGLPGAGAKTVRQGLYHELLETWGYGVRLQAFQHYEALGMGEATALLWGGSNGGAEAAPPVAVRDLTEHCSGQPSEIYRDLYQPIWDGGANGTAINELNPFALYVFKTVEANKAHVRFWEIWNEPGFDLSFDKGWRPAGDPAGNWWDANPAPCEYKLRAPIFHYVRMLRIAWEVVKTLDPDSFVALGAPGYPSFLDAVLRNTDNPVDGSPTAQFPLGGGAYFDAVAFHSYPHFDGSTVIDVIAQTYLRTSDRAADGVASFKKSLEDVLIARGFDGAVFPKKTFIATECNLPRKSFGGQPFYFGSEEAQRNFWPKAIVAAKKSGIAQVHVFAIAETRAESAAVDEFQAMGFFKNIDNVAPADAIRLPSGTAAKTASDLIGSARFDEAMTALLAPSVGIRAAAFERTDGKWALVLWAEAAADGFETASATFKLPSNLAFSGLQRRDWDFSATGLSSAVQPSEAIFLTAAPIFLIADAISTKAAEPDFSEKKNLIAAPNPFDEALFVSADPLAGEPVSFEIRSATGALLWSGARVLEAGFHSLFEKNSLPEGLCFLKMTSRSASQTVALIKIR